MTIRKKLMISHLCMIAIPILLAVVVGAGVFFTYGSRFWDSPEEMFDDLSLSDAADWAVYECVDQYCYGAEYADDEYERDAALLAYGQGNDEIWSYLMKTLAAMGYQVQVTVDGTVLADNLTQNEETAIMQYFPDSARMKNRTVSRRDIVITNSYYEEDGAVIEVTAVSQTPWKTMAYLLLYVLFVIFVVILTNVLLMNWLRKSIMMPLDALRRGTRQIAEGNLDSTIAYAKEDEFGEVCRDFDGMRRHLKDSVDAQADYDKNRQEMLSGISHDLRTPLTSIKGYAEGLKDGIANTEERRQRYYDAIHMCALEMEALLDSLSTFSRLENKAYQYRLETTDFAEYMERLVQNYQEEILRRNAALLYENRAERTLVEIDRQEMQRVFMNLFENSIRYRTGETCAIRILMQNDGDRLVVFVRDDGPGVPEGELENIFHLFYRGDASRSKADGSGLGLSIVRRIIEGHGGSIRAYNDRGLVMEIALLLAKDVIEETSLV